MFICRYWLKMSLTIVFLILGQIMPHRSSFVDAACPNVIPFGELLECTLSVVGEQDTFTFTGNANDKLYFRVYRISGNLSARLVVRNPANTSVCQVDAFQANPFVELSCTLTSSGNYSVTIDDENSTSTGSYQVYSQRLNNVGNATAIAYGKVTSGSLSSVIEGDTYIFDAEQNDKMVLRLYRTTGTFSGRIQLFDRAANLVCEANAFQGSALVTSDPCIINQSGSYSLIIDDENGNALGDYQFHLQRYRNAGNTQPISFGLPITEMLALPIELDGYTVNAEVNDKLLVRIIRETGSYSPRIRLFDKDGDQVCAVDAFQNYPVAEIEYCSIIDTGLHTIFVDDENLNGTGAYRVQLQRVNNPGNTIPLVFGQQMKAQIEGIASFDSYIIRADVAQTFKVTMIRSSGNISSRVRIYDSGGTIICSADAFQGNAEVEIPSCVIPQAGNYTVIADDESLNGVGNYSLLVTCITGGCQQHMYLPLINR